MATNINKPWLNQGKKPEKNYEETTDFLQQLRDPPWLLTAIVPDGITATITAHTAEQVVSFVRKHDSERNLYFSVNPTRGTLTHKASKVDISEVQYLLADLDPQHDEPSDKAKERYLAAIAELRPAPTAIIDSGNGLQCLWRLTTAIELPEPIIHENKRTFDAQTLKVIENIEARSAGLMQKLGSLAGTQNIDRILRLPGTINIPNKKKLEAGRIACPTKLLRFNTLTYPLTDFPLPEIDPKEQVHQQQNGHKEQSFENAAQIFEKLGAAMRKLVAGEPFEGEDTSTTCASVITEMQKRGYQDIDIVKLFQAFPRGIGKRYANGKDLQADVARLRRKYEQDSGFGFKTPTIMPAADLRPEIKQWLWKGHLLRGSLELLSGIPGLGKSQVQISFIACVTAGLTWPDGTPGCDPHNVIMMTAEDSLTQDVLPRLIAAGADLKRVFILQNIRKDNKNRAFLLAEDLDALERAALEIGDVHLIAIDPITAYMGGKLDSHKATEVRSQLGPLKDLSERTNIGISTITHPAKAAGPRAMDHFIGSQAFIAAGRIGHICSAEKVEDENGQSIESGRILFSMAKTNVWNKMPTLAFSQEVVVVEPNTDPDKVIEAPRVIWDPEPLAITADEAVANANGLDRGKHKESDRILNYLSTRLESGPVPVKVIEKEAEGLKFTARQLQYAKEKLGIISRKVEGSGKISPWIWELPCDFGIK